MIFPKNTEWKVSTKGNYWRKLDGVMLITGGSDARGFWARVDEDFLKEKYESLDQAKSAAEKGI